MRNNTNDFSVAKFGDRVYNYVKDEYGTVIANYGDFPFGLVVNFEDGTEGRFTHDGKEMYLYDINPILFWDKPQIIAPPKPFDLKSFLREQLVPVEFDSSRENYFFVYDNLHNTFTVNASKHDEYTAVYFGGDNVYYIARVLREEQITMKELIKAFKELGWL